MRISLEIERLNDAEFFNASRSPEQTSSPVELLKPNWVRHFCGGARLVHESGCGLSSNSPVWNIQVTETQIIDGHNDISKPILTNMLRQLYVDSVKYPYFAD